jgi:hypothetical protein
MRRRGFDVDGPNGLFPMPTESPSTLGLCSRRSKTETPATKPPKTRTSPTATLVAVAFGSDA